MKKLNYADLISQTVSELENLERQQNIARFRDYVRYLRYLKTGIATSQVSSGAMIGLKPRQSQALWKSYISQGLNHLLQEHRTGTVGRLTYVQISQLQSFLRSSQIPMTQQQIAQWIGDNFGVTYTQSGISVLFKRLKIKLKTGRPVNVRQNLSEIEAFKKTTQRLSMS